MPHGLQNLHYFVWFRVYTTNRLRSFRDGGGAKSIWRPPPLGSLKYSRPSSRNRLLGTKLSCPTKPETTSTRGGADKEHGAVSTAASVANSRAPGLCFVLVFRLKLIWAEKCPGIPYFG